MRKKIGKTVILILIICFAMLPYVKTEAASYKIYSITENKTTKIGSKKIKLSVDRRKLYVYSGGKWKNIVSIKNKNRGIGSIISDGRNIIFDESVTNIIPDKAYYATINRVPIKGGNIKQIIKLKNVYDYSFQAIYKDKVYFSSYSTKSSSDDIIYKTYCMNFRSGKVKRTKIDFDIIQKRKKYLLLQESDLVNGGKCYSQIAILNMSNDKINIITKKGYTGGMMFEHHTGYISGKYIYYAEYLKEGDNSKEGYPEIVIQIKKCKLDGSEKKKIGKSLKVSSLVKFNSKYVEYCINSDDMHSYRYYYKTGKTVKVN